MINIFVRDRTSHKHVMTRNIQVQSRPGEYTKTLVNHSTNCGRDLNMLPHSQNDAYPSNHHLSLNPNSSAYRRDTLLGAKHHECFTGFSERINMNPDNTSDKVVKT